jgi:hypothetical protein
MCGTRNAFEWPPTQSSPGSSLSLVRSATRVEVPGSVEENLRVSKGLFLLPTAAVCCLAFAGCGNPPGHYPVYGRVLYKGEPASGAVIYFRPEGPSATAMDTPPVGIADQDGNFHLTRDGIGDGCPPGKYAVLLEWKGKAEDAVAEPKPVPAKGKSKAKTKEFAVNKQMARQGIDRLKGRYFDSSKPLLHAEVLPQSNSLPPFEIGS